MSPKPFDSLSSILFFNTTTKTNKAEEIFNRYSDKDKVSVRGEIVIDDYKGNCDFFDDDLDFAEAIINVTRRCWCW